MNEGKRIGSLRWAEIIFTTWFYADIEITQECISWTDDWEQEFKRKNCLVVEARLLTKYKNFSFKYDNG